MKPILSSKTISFNAIILALIALAKALNLEVPTNELGWIGWLFTHPEVWIPLANIALRFVTSEAIDWERILPRKQEPGQR